MEMWAGWPSALQYLFFICCTLDDSKVFVEARWEGSRVVDDGGWDCAVAVEPLARGGSLGNVSSLFLRPRSDFRPPRSLFPFPPRHVKPARRRRIRRVICCRLRSRIRACRGARRSGGFRNIRGSSQYFTLALDGLHVRLH